MNPADLAQRQSRLRPGGLGVLLSCMLLVLVLWTQVADDPAGPWASLFDNLHWTFAYTAAALMVWLSLRGRAPEVAAPRRWVAIGLSCLALGQWMWDLQVYVGWNPFPGPSDAAFILPGLCMLAAFARVIRDRLPAARYRNFVLDVAGFALAALALVLTVYLPRGLESTALQMVVLTMYPVLLLSASAAAVVMQIYLRLRWDWRWSALFAGLVGQAVVWMMWNIATLDNALAAGSHLNLAFSMLTLLLGWGAAGWRALVDPSPKFDRLCEGLVRQLPLAMVAMTSTAMGLLVLDHSMPQLMRNLLLVPGLASILFAAWRQTTQLSERDQLLVTERVLAESRAQLEYLAHHDALTGLPNLTLLRERVQTAISQADATGQRVALLFIDLDQFKEVNDSLGHSMGDMLLSHTARQLERTVRQTDTVCRHGGDEFVVVLPAIRNITDVVQVSDKLMTLAGGSASLNGHELPMAMSIGVALYPDDASNFDTLLQCADTAMYRAKDSGRNTCRFYDAEMNRESASRMQTRGRLARALERGELRIHYQPLVNLASGRIIGAEALLRWQHPEVGMVPPDVFIPVAEDSGLIVPIGTWVLNQACIQAAEWRTAGMEDVSISVNLSVLQFRRGRLEEVVVEALRSSGLPAHCLELEITESVMMLDHDKVISTMNRLRQLGVRLAIDDFGTGYSSLSYLKRLPATKVKIDKSLIHDAASNPRGAAIVRAVIAMARELGLTSVAEGVENRVQFELMTRYRCDQAQGHLFGRPMPPEEFDLLVHQEADTRGNYLAEL